MYPSIINEYLTKTQRCQTASLPADSAHRSPYRVGHRLIGSYYIYSSLPDDGAAAQMS
jgi:hypothetical protein